MCPCILSIWSDSANLDHTTSFLSFRPTGESPSSFSGLQRPAVCTHALPSIPLPSLLFLLAHQAPAILPPTVLEPPGMCWPRASAPSPLPACKRSFKHPHGSSTHCLRVLAQMLPFQGGSNCTFSDSSTHPHLSSCLYFSA